MVSLCQIITNCFPPVVPRKLPDQGRWGIFDALGDIVAVAQSTFGDSSGRPRPVLRVPVVVVVADEPFDA